MSQIERIGISVEKDLLEDFDELIAGLGYKNRSEAIRDLIRTRLSQKRLEDSKAEAVAAIFLIYDHHTAHISNIFKELHHSKCLKTISSVHVYVDRNNCLEIIVVKGKAEDINQMGNKMISLKGVKQGYINLVATNS